METKNRSNFPKCCPSMSLRVFLLSFFASFLLSLLLSARPADKQTDRQTDRQCLRPPPVSGQQKHQQTNTAPVAIELIEHLACNCNCNCNWGPIFAPLDCLPRDSPPPQKPLRPADSLPPTRSSRVTLARPQLASGHCLRAEVWPFLENDRRRVAPSALFIVFRAPFELTLTICVSSESSSGVWGRH